MKKLTMIALALLAGCGPMGLYYKPGISLAGIERDEIACTLKAEREVPVRNVSRVIPGQWIPGHKVCPKKGQCHVTPGYMTPSRVVTEDANLGLRNRVAALCMQDRGYSRISLPPCPREVAQSVPPAITTVMPKRLSPSACVIRHGRGAFQVVNRD
ncbi:hypothetical protein [Aquicoccus porphyridii]|uniref:Lipoprotein n=1 Tax=Aquicoccus porphyridii TaxID=1852029 RepID=A0A5A9ZVI7_9RHOB|nr:hypothetical protein [Aquicoccus porphyridii]KAA0920936.1 hypothetical protein FLO80_01815 [Aquicoccus porphyridii]RAI56525.1 hypothetical protein DOO74_01265 [Rhodobacteraceae bacterium AsT-22]